MEPNKQDMLDKIYEVIADKTLSCWCNILLPNHHNKWPYVYINEEHFFNGYVILNNKEQIVNIDEWDITVMWHPVMIGDVLDWIENRDNTHDNISDWYAVTKYWKNKRHPIENQSDECIEYIFNLLPKE